MSRLTDKQKAFIVEYVKDFNGTQAAIRAGYSENTANVIASQNLTKLNIREAIDNYFADKVMSANEVLYHLTEVARGDIGDLITHYGEPDLETASELGKTNLIQSIKTKTIVSGKDDSETHFTELKLYDRLRALDLLAKYHNLTNNSNVKIEETWRTELLDAIREDAIDYETCKEVLVDFGQPASLADEFFRKVGKAVEVDNVSSPSRDS